MTPNSDPRIDQAAVTDESLLAAHEKLLGKQPDDQARYQPMPLVLLFVFAGLLFFGATYLNRYSGRFDPLIFNENLESRAQLQAAGPAAAVDPVAMGKKLFNDAACNTCHQATGLGQPGAIPPLAGSEWAQGSEERVIRIVLYGLQGPITVKGAAFNSAMPAFGKGAPASMKNWSDDKIAAVLTYVRQEWGNTASPISADKVTEIHNKEATRGPMTAAELEKLP